MAQVLSQIVLVAGLGGFGWTMTLPFTAIFVVWLMILRPEQWPASPEEWLTAAGLAGRVGASPVADRAGRKMPDLIQKKRRFRDPQQLRID
ncbi:hypothetical protein [Mycobacterium tuberculosis]|uniref:hypothetical protein n=1 Tax=Mycobacterium tuberculosis TaxID=1773 RepID=UPI002729D093|nr:hypothetical protein [Mycobacterium tuberculosis]